MRSLAYVDFCVRLREAILLVKAAKRSRDPQVAVAYSKSATVLIAAALERYVNDALYHASRSIKVKAWADLPNGVKAFLIVQIARRLRNATGSIRSPKDATESTGRRVRSVVRDCSEAFVNPSSWSYMPQLGVFMDGAVSPEKLNAVLLNYRTDGKEFFARIEERGLDRGVFARALTDLVNTRHATAHAISDRTPPSPKDVSAWLSIAFRVVREIEEYLRESLAQSMEQSSFS